MRSLWLVLTAACVSLGLLAPAGAQSTQAEATSRLNLEWTPFPDETRFEVLGLHWFKQNAPRLWRMPASEFDLLTSGVKNRCKAPSGGRIAFACNAGTLALRVLPRNKGSAKGFDVYIDGRFYRSVIAEEPDTEKEIVLFKDLDRSSKKVVVYLPAEQEVLIKAVGADAGTMFTPARHQYARPLPVVFYGSSVCQGNGAIKPGMTYEAIACRRLNLDFVNLGFGGAGKAEPAIVDLVDSIPACCYVFDLGKSYGSQDRSAFEAMLRKIRGSHPKVPIICITPIASSLELHSKDYSARSLHTRQVMREAADEFIRSGEQQVYLLEGTDLLGSDELDGMSRDGVHPTDYGYSIIAGKLAPVLSKAIGLAASRPEQ